MPPQPIVAPARRGTGRRRVLLATAAIILSTSVATSLILGVDVWLHARNARWLGYNVWGYRGPALSRKRPGEYRIAMLGGSVAYGYAVQPTDTIPVLLQRDLRAATGSDRFTVVNLAYNNEGAYSFAFTLRDYEYLRYDLAILYEGYNDIADNPRNTSVFRRQSPVFRLTGYLPIFPLIFREKAAAMLHGGDVAALYRDTGKPVFRPSWTTRAGAQALMTAADIETAIERRLDAVSKVAPDPRGSGTGAGCPHVPHYCQSIADAVDVARARSVSVLVGSQPYLPGNARAQHQRQQHELAAMLAQKYGGDPKVGYVNLGGLLDLTNPKLSEDGMHPTREGNAATAAALAPAVLKIAGAAPTAK